jgi:F0F1-type ATP synthase membrane subunit c/vacuolar-type H+-ATPase subunit K
MVDLVAVYAIGLPALGALLAVATGGLSWRSATRGLDPATRRRMVARLLVYCEIPGLTVLFGVALYFLILGRSAELPPAQLEWAALTVGIPGMLAGFGYAIVFRRGVAHSVAVPLDFGRVVVLAALSETVAMFGFAMGSLILGQAAAGSVSVADVVEASRVASLYMIAGSLFAPVEAYAMVTYWKFESQRRWSRSIVVGAVLEIPVLVTFALAFLSLVRT